MPMDPLFDQLVGAVVALDPAPRAGQWVSLSFCVLDAVYSIGAHYDRHVVPVVRRVARSFAVAEPVLAPPVTVADPVPVDVFLHRFSDVGSLLAVTENRQKTSPRGGIRKADAVLRYAAILDGHGVRTLDDARAALADDAVLSDIDAALRGCPVKALTVCGAGICGCSSGPIGS